jgi:hypothetical protein
MFVSVLMSLMKTEELEFTDVSINKKKIHKEGAVEAWLLFGIAYTLLYTVFFVNYIWQHVHPPSSQHYSPGWALASPTTSLHCCLSFVFFIHCFIFIIFKSATQDLKPIYIHL